MNNVHPQRPPAGVDQGSRVKPFDTPEGHILLSGLALSLLYTVILAASYIISPQAFHVFVGMTATNVLFGRAAGMSFGYALGFGHSVIIPVNLAVEVIMVMLVYPLFVFSWRHLLVIKRLDNLMRRIKHVAEANEKFIRRYGIPSLFLFVLFPFWMTGPVVGCVIGFFLGLKPWVNLSVVLVATALAIVAWAALLRELHEQVADFSPFAPVILLVIIIGLAIAGYLLESRHRHE